MNEAFIVDASVGISWVYPTQASAVTDKWLEEITFGAIVVVPSLWYWEVANGLLAAQRRRLLTATERRKALQRLSLLNFAIDEDAGRNAFSKTSELAEKHGLTVYDAAYLELALRRKLSLASRDEALLKAGRRTGVKLHG